MGGSHSGSVALSRSRLPRCRRAGLLRSVMSAYLVPSKLSLISPFTLNGQVAGPGHGGSDVLVSRLPNADTAEL